MGSAHDSTSSVIQREIHKDKIHILIRDKHVHTLPIVGTGHTTHACILYCDGAVGEGVDEPVADLARERQRGSVMDRDSTPLCDAAPNKAEADRLACKRHGHLRFDAFDIAMIADIAKVMAVTGNIAHGLWNKYTYGQGKAYNKLQKMRQEQNLQLS